MIEDETEVKLGEIGWGTSHNKGNQPELWAERCTHRIWGISETAEVHIRQQATEFRLAI